MKQPELASAEGKLMQAGVVLKPFAFAMLLLATAITPISAQTWEGTAAAIRAGEIEDGLFAASNAFEPGTVVDIRNLETDAVVTVRVVRRANGSMFLLLAPTAARALDMDASAIARVSAQIVGLPQAAPVVAEETTRSRDPDIDPAAAIPPELEEFLASLPELESDPPPAIDIAAAEVEPDLPAAVLGAPQRPDSPEIGPSEAELLATASDPAAVLQPDQIAVAPADPAVVGVAAEPASEPVATSAEVLDRRQSPDLPPAPAVLAAEPTVPSPDEQIADSTVESPEQPQLLAVDTIPPVPPARELLAVAPPLPGQPPERKDIVDDPPQAVARAVPPGAEASLPAPPVPDPLQAETAIVTAPSDSLPTIPEPDREAVARASRTPAPTALPDNRIVTLEPVAPRPPAPQPISRVAAADDAAGADALAARHEPDPDQQPAEQTVVAADTVVVAETETQTAVGTPTGTAVLRAPGSPPTGARGPFFLLQLGAYTNSERAERLVQALPDSYGPAVVSPPGDRPVYKVVIGPLTRHESGTLLYQFRASGFPDAFLVPDGS